MTFSVQDVLAHSALAPAAPIVRAGADALDRTVRWVHSSEVLEIAHLLRGGELLLTGGVVLAATDAVGRRRYARELAARGIAGLAIETGSELPEIPDELRSEADELGLPVIELRRVVPFVAVTEEINGLLVNESVRGLRAADALSQSLSEELANGGGPQELVDALGAGLGCAVALLDLTGRPVGATAGAVERIGDPGALAVPVSMHGMSLARLVVIPAPQTDPVAVHAALERAPQILGLALARIGAVGPEDRAVRELLRCLRTGDHRPERIAVVARAAGLPGSAVVVGVAACGDGDLVGLGAVDAILRQHGRQVLLTVEDGMLFGLVVIPAPEPEKRRAALIADLSAARRLGRIRIGVGPSAGQIARYSHTVAEAERCLTVADELAWPRRVLDAADIGVELLAHRVGSTSVIDDFVQDQLGPILALGDGRAAVLIETLATYYGTGCAKTATARALNLQRQTLYQRLNRAFGALGGDPTGTPRAVAVQLAARLYLARPVDASGPAGRRRRSN